MKLLSTVVFVTLLNATVGVWCYNLGTLAPQTVHEPLAGYKQSRCDEMNARKNFYTGKWDLVCEVKMQAEDDNLLIFKGEGER